VEHDDFSIRFVPSGDGRYSVVAEAANGGEVSGTFEIPFELDEFGRVRRGCRAGGALAHDGGSDAYRHLEPLASDAQTRASPLSPREVGERLFEALFSGRVRSLLDQNLGRVEPGGERGLCLRLRFNLRDPGLLRLASLPWELLYSRERQRFLCLSRFTPVIRHLSVPVAARPWRREPPVRVLVAMGPTSSCPLELPSERRKILESLDGREDIKLIFLDPVTTRSLERELREGPVHVVHFMGHGDFSPDSRAGAGTLIFNDDKGAEEPVTGEKLADLLYDQQQLGLVLLNACDTARVTTREGLDPFAGVATALVMAGVPAVVAMQLPISDSAALLFCEAFYQSLAAGEEPEASTAAGRQAILGGDVSLQEWATPALYLRTAPVPRPPVQPSSKESVQPPSKKADGLRRPILIRAVLAVLPLVELLGYATQRARESFLGMAPLDYSVWKLLLDGADVLWSLPWRGLGSLFLGEGVVVRAVVLLLLLTLLWLALDRWRLPSWSTLAALTLSSLLLVGGGAFYTVVLESAYLTANEPRSEPRCGTQLSRNMTERSAFEICSWLENDSQLNDERRESLSGLLFWLLLACAAVGTAGWRYPLDGKASNLRRGLVAFLGLFFLFLLARLPLTHAYGTWGLKYPPVEKVLAECDPDLSQKIDSGICSGFDVSAGARQTMLFLHGDCESFAALPKTSEDGRRCVRRAPTERGVLSFLESRNTRQIIGENR
jgi:hypothetical protein